MQHQQSPHQQQQRFFQNNQPNFNNQGRVRQPNFHQQQQQQHQNRPQGNQQQQQQNAANPFIPLQASRKATKSKNPQAETKPQPKVEVVTPKVVKPIAVPMVSIPETKPEVQAEPKKSSTTPTVRKSRLGISFESK
jgi:hypothetical protein